MNEKEARVLGHQLYQHLHDDRITCAKCEAVGYIEAIEKAQGLEEALSLYAEEAYSFDGKKIGREAVEALAKWEKEK